MDRQTYLARLDAIHRAAQAAHQRKVAGIEARAIVAGGLLELPELRKRLDELTDDPTLTAGEVRAIRAAGVQAWTLRHPNVMQAFTAVAKRIRDAFAPLRAVLGGPAPRHREDVHRAA